METMETMEAPTPLSDEEMQFRSQVALLIAQASRCPSGSEIFNECLSVAAMLLEKNRKYGDAALNPRRIFSKSTPVEQILVRIDDKLNRVMQGEKDEHEDVIQDLLGYIVLLRIAKARQAKSSSIESAP